MLHKGFKLLLVLLLALSWLSPVTPVSAATYTAEFTLTATPEPSAFEHAVTLSLSAAGPDGAEYPPFGDVTFYDNGEQLHGCTGSLNHVNYTPTAGTPASCTFTLNVAGEHTITAYFVSKMPDLYDSQSIGPITHVVSDPYVVSILPETIPTAPYGGTYVQNLTFDATVTGYGTTGDLPPGWVFYVDNNTGVVGGRATALGDYTFTVNVSAYPGGRGSRTYTASVEKATPLMDVYLPENGFHEGTIETYYAYANPEALTYGVGLVDPYGTVTFTLDGTPINGCVDLPTETSGNAVCAFPGSGITAGDHAVQAVFTPDDTTGAYYTGVTAEGTLQVLPPLYDIEITIFDDLNKDGVQDTGSEGLAKTDLDVDVDQGCDGSIDAPGFSGTGTLTFAELPSGSTYCVILSDLPAGYEQTTTNQFVLDTDPYPVLVGLSYPHLIFRPESLPNGSLGQNYNQTIQVSNGTPPYSISSKSLTLPPGLSFDESSFTISGVPTAGGMVQVSIDFVDAAGLTGNYYTWFFVPAQGSYSLTSSQNPAAPGEEVTFSLSASGVAYTPYSPDPVPPVGLVTFYDSDPSNGGTAIDGCSDLYLNLDSTGTSLGDYPAVCTTAALAEGEHTITAVYTDWTMVYPAGTVASLAQVIGPTGVAPAVTAQPASQSLSVGQDGSFSAAASGEPTPTVQWQVSSDSGATWSDIAGATAEIYAFTAAYAQNGYQYRAVFTNDLGSAASDAAVLTVLPGQTSTTLSVPAGSVLLKEPVTLSVAVAALAPAAGTPEGTVTFKDGRRVLATVTLSGGQASFTTSALSAGTHSLTAVYNGADGWVASRSAAASLAVIYQSAGFTAPVDIGGVINLAKPGKTIPIKFRLTDARGVPVANLRASAFQLTLDALTTCPVGSTDVIETYTNAPAGLQNLGKGYYQYNWKTPKTRPGTCKSLTLTINGLAQPGFTALFQFK